jgi:hypothetical protein
MTEYWRSLGLETHEEVSGEEPTSCRTCGRLFASGLCGCTDVSGAQMPQRVVNVNSSFIKLCRSLSKTNIDVHVKWLHEEDPPEEASEVPPESALWKSVPHHRNGMSMLDVQRLQWRDRSADAVSCREKILEGRCAGVLFQGNPPVARILADQFAFFMKDTNKSAVWDSNDHSEGYLVVASEGKRAFSEAFKKAAVAVKEFQNRLQAFLDQRRPLALNTLTPLQGNGLSLGAEVGGTLQLHTSGEMMKQVAIGVAGFAHSAQRVWRAFLIEAPTLEMFPLNNCSYAPKETCNEQELRSEFQRNVLGYLYLATTLVTLPIRRCFLNKTETLVLEAELRLDTGCAHIAASHIYVGDDRVFHKDVVLGANPYVRGWCLEKKLTLKLLLHRARVEHHPTAWSEIGKLSEEMGTPSLPDLDAKLDASLTSSMPAMNALDHRPVFEIQVRKGDVETYQRLDSEVCGYGVLDGHPMGDELVESSRMFCVGCQDCIRYFEKDEATAQKSIMDIEDTTVSASSFFNQIDVSNRRRLFETSIIKRRRSIYYL